MLLVTDDQTVAMIAWRKQTGCITRQCHCDDLPSIWEVAAFDHVFEVESHSGTKGHLLQPYAFDYEKAAELEEWCVEHDHSWRCWGGAGFWDPRTISILIFPNPPVS
jgi:hypothetical protein